MHRPIVKLIRVDLLDEPEVIARIEIPDDYIRQLADSIASTGLINPICVRAENGRYRIYAGHCRYLAVKSLGWSEVECKDYTATDIPAEQIKIRENLDRRDMTDAEWVVFLVELREKHDYDLDALKAVTGKSEAWIADRMSVHRAGGEVMDALLAGDIKLGHALALNRFPEQYRRLYLLRTIASTPPIKVVNEWFKEFELMNLPTDLPADSPPVVEPSALPGLAQVEPCRFCNEQHSPWAMEFVKVHKGCLQTVLNALHGGS